MYRFSENKSTCNLKKTKTNVKLQQVLNNLGVDTKSYIRDDRFPTTYAIITWNLNKGIQWVCFVVEVFWFQWLRFT